MPGTSNTVVSGGSDGRESPDYGAVEIPSKPPTEFTYHERRADILDQIRDLGHPSMLNQTELADRYGVCQQQISKDISRLAESVREHVVDRDRRAFAVDTVVQRSIRGLLEEGEYRQAAKTAMEWDDWVTEFHDLREMERKIEELKQQR